MGNNKQTQNTYQLAALTVQTADNTDIIQNQGSSPSPGTPNILIRTGNPVLFDKDAEYLPITTGTFTVDTTSKATGAVVVVYLNSGTTQPTLSSSFKNIGTVNYAANKDLMYVFKVGANNQIQYTITDLT